jgi:hypothetical protein
VRSRAATIITVAVLGLATAPAAVASGARASWARGVTVVPDSSLPPRDDPAVVAMGDRILVAGGGRVGEGTPIDPHVDGAILDLTTRTWRSIAPMPFPLAGATGIWTGRDVVLVGGRPNCLADTSGCPTTTLAAAVYTVATNRWRAIALPAKYLEPNRWVTTALHWSGHEALFSLGAPGIAIRPGDGAVRAIAAPPPEPAAGQCDTGREFVSVALRHPDPQHVRVVPTVVDRTGRRAATGPAHDLAASGSPWSVACTSGQAFVASGDGSVVARYDLAMRRWRPVTPLQGTAPCVIGAALCEQYRFSGHGTVLDAWVPGQAVAHRLVGSANGWHAVAAGPGTDTSVNVTWAGGLGVTTRIDPVTGFDTGELAVWRPV